MMAMQFVIAAMVALGVSEIGNQSGSYVLALGLETAVAMAFVSWIAAIVIMAPWVVQKVKGGLE